MRKFLPLAAISAAAFAASSPATASVTYDFNVGGSAQVTFTVDDFLIGSGIVAASDIVLCTDQPCDVSFDDNAFDSLFVTFASLGLVSGSFNDGAFTTPGTYFSGHNRLIVSEVSTAVPEPATWAMMLLGFGAVGFALRRRKLTELIFRRAA